MTAATRRRAGASALAALALAAAGLAGAPAASAAECHPDGSRYFCGKLIVTRYSECASLSFGGWTKSIGGEGTGASIVRPGQTSTLYHRDSDGIDPDDACRWYGARADGRAATSIPVSAAMAKNRLGRTWTIVGVRK